MSNEITAYFKGRKGVCESVYQYDYGMIMILDGLDFVNNFDCYFSVPGEDEAMPAIGYDNRVVIPNDCLTRAGDVTLHIPSHTGENDSEVEYVVTFRVIGRARPADDGTTEEQSAVSKAIAMLNHTVSDVIERIDAYLDENAAEPIQAWLDDHPEATTTVEDDSLTTAKYKDESVTSDKLSSDLSDTIRTSEFVNNIRLNTNAFMYLYGSGYSSVQGACVIDDRYIVVCRYYTGDERHLCVYDAIDKTVVSTNVFTDAQVGHCNSLTYDNGYIYVATLTSNKSVVRLKWNSSSHTITYDSVVYTPTISSIAVHNGQVYMMKSVTNGIEFLKGTTAFDDIETAFTTSFADTSSHLAIQGMSFDGKYIYVPMSGDYQNGSGELANRLTRYTEYIFVLTTEGELIKTFSYPRGIYREIEDVDIITVQSQSYIVISMNQDDRGVAYVYVSPIYANTIIAPQFATADVSDISIYNDDILEVYVSATNGTLFADGTQAHPFNGIYPALSFIKRANVPAKMFIKEGTYSEFQISGLTVPLTIFFDEGTITGASIIYRCAPITFDRSLGVSGTNINLLEIAETVVMARYSPNHVGSGSGIGLKLTRAVFVGSAGVFSGYQYAIQGLQAFGNMSATINDSTPLLLQTASPMLSINGVIYGASMPS